MRRAHSIHEMKDYLARRANDPNQVAPIIARLREGKYLDDARYAADYARQHAQSRRQGRFRIRASFAAAACRISTLRRLLTPFSPKRMNLPWCAPASSAASRTSNFRWTSVKSPLFIAACSAQASLLTSFAKNYAAPPAGTCLTWQKPPSSKILDARKGRLCLPRIEALQSMRFKNLRRRPSTRQNTRKLI